MDAMDTATRERIQELMSQLEELEARGADDERLASERQHIREEIACLAGYGLAVYLSGKSIGAVCLS